jgi:hypothetical protein
MRSSSPTIRHKCPTHLILLDVIILFVNHLMTYLYYISSRDDSAERAR